MRVHKSLIYPETDQTQSVVPGKYSLTVVFLVTKNNDVGEKHFVFGSVHLLFRVYYIQTSRISILEQLFYEQNIKYITQL